MRPGRLHIQSPSRVHHQKTSPADVPVAFRCLLSTALFLHQDFSGSLEDDDEHEDDGGFFSLEIGERCRLQMPLAPHHVDDWIDQQIQNR
jgi:hypothetical protein